MVRTWMRVPKFGCLAKFVTSFGLPNIPNIIFCLSHAYLANIDIPARQLIPIHRLSRWISNIVMCIYNIMCIYIYIHILLLLYIHVYVSLDIYSIAISYDISHPLYFFHASFPWPHWLPHRACWAEPPGTLTTPPFPDDQKNDDETNNHGDCLIGWSTLDRNVQQSAKKQ